MQSFDKKGSYKAVTDITVFCDGLLFYKCEAGKVFNLPEGTYDVHGVYYEVPFTYKKIMEFPKAYHVEPKKFQITFIDNYPNKCSIWLDSGKVLADSSFKRAQKFVFMFVLCHEFGHFYYRGNGEISEMMCDKYARQAMLFLGYNPSQIDLAIQITLSDSSLSKKRKKNSFNQLKK